MAIGVYAQPSRVTLYASDGVTPTKRYTFPSVKSSGRELKFVLEGTTTTGALPHRHIFLNADGFRPVLSLKWDVDAGSVPTPTKYRGALLENWSGSAWVAASGYKSCLAAAKDIQVSSNETSPCLVEAYADASGFAPFLARAFDPIISEEDVKGMLHTNVALVLRGIQTTGAPINFDIVQYGTLYGDGYYQERS